MSRQVRFLVAAPLLAAAAVLMPQLVTATHSVPSTVDESELQTLAETNEDEAIDLYGNQVTAAVATYEFDATGTPYERHSPQTQLPRLGSPKS